MSHLALVAEQPKPDHCRKIVVSELFFCSLQVVQKTVCTIFAQLVGSIFSQAPCQYEKVGPLVPIADYCYLRSNLLVSTKFFLVLIAPPEFMLARFVTREDLFGRSEASKTNMHCIVLALSTTSSFHVQMFDGSTGQ